MTNPPRGRHLRILEGAGAPPGERPEAQAARAADVARAAATIPAAAELPVLSVPFPYLNEKQCKVWVEIYAEHGSRLGDSDRTLFAKLVVAESLYREACEKVGTVGTLIKSPTGYPIQNPYLAVVNKQTALITRLSAELGITPAARSRVKNPGKGPRTRRDNPFSDLRTLED